MKMEIASAGWSEKIITIVLINIRKIANNPYLYFYFNGDYHTALLKNPEAPATGLLTGTEIKIKLFTPVSEKYGIPEAELIINNPGAELRGMALPLKQHLLFI